MFDFIKNNVGSIISLSAIFTALGLFYRFYRTSIFESDIYSDSEDSYAYVLDSERDTLENKYSYYINSKVIIDAIVGDAFKLMDAFLVIKEYGQYWNVQWPSSNAPENVRSFFTNEEEGRTLRDTSSGKRFMAKGVAERIGEAFYNRPSGGYTAFAIFVLDRFTVTLPLRLASFRDGGHSRICGSASVLRRSGKSIKPEEVAKTYPDFHLATENYNRVRLCILDFDFLPFISPFWSFCLKKN